MDSNRRKSERKDEPSSVPGGSSPQAVEDNETGDDAAPAAATKPVQVIGPAITPQPLPKALPPVQAIGSAITPQPLPKALPVQAIGPAMAPQPLPKALPPVPEPEKSADPLIGSIVKHYQILSFIGRGGMSSVYKARNVLTKRLVALKMMHMHKITDATSAARFQREAIAAGRLSHRNCITVYDMDTTDDHQPFLIMDYLEGRSVHEEIVRSDHGCLPVGQCLHIFKQACDGLSDAHDHGVLHRDLKPSNIMLINQESDPDFVKVVDFGIAKIMEEEGDVLRLTSTGEVFGSPLYMSPEQCQGLPLDARSDVYSMGILMYEALTGHPPFEGGNVMETLYKQMNLMPEGLNQLDADINTVNAVNAMVMKALNKRPGARQQTMRELKEEIEKIELYFNKKFKLWNPLAKLQMQIREAGRSLFNFVGGRWTPILVFGAGFFVVGIICVAIYLRSTFVAPSLANRIIPIKPISVAALPAPSDGSFLNAYVLYFKNRLWIEPQDYTPKVFYDMLQLSDIMERKAASSPDGDWKVPGDSFLRANLVAEVLKKQKLHISDGDLARVYRGRLNCMEHLGLFEDPATLNEAIQLSLAAADLSHQYALQLSYTMPSSQLDLELHERARLCRLLEHAKVPVKLAGTQYISVDGEYKKIQQLIDTNWSRFTAIPVSTRHADEATKFYPSLERAQDFCQVADHCFQVRAYTQARRMYETALLLWEKCEGSTRSLPDLKFNIAATENQLGMSIMQLADHLSKTMLNRNPTLQANLYDQAQRKFNDAEERLRKAPGDHNQDLVGVLYNEADALWRLHQYLPSLWTENVKARGLQMQIGSRPLSANSKE